jgi:hypothetical protein
MKKKDSEFFVLTLILKMLVSTVVPILYNDAPQFSKDFIKPPLPFLNLCICIKCTLISFCIFKILICIFHSI